MSCCIMDTTYKYKKYKKKFLSERQRLTKMTGGGNLVQIAWNSIVSFTARNRAFVPKFDGLKFWTGDKDNGIDSLKKLLNKVDDVTGENDAEWNPEHAKIRDEIDKFELAEKDEFGNLIESNHFILQQRNIPVKDDAKPSFRRLMQIALNIGQGLAHPMAVAKEGVDPRDIIETMRNLNMTSLETYMTPDQYSKYKFTPEDLIQLLSLLSDLTDNPVVYK